MKKLFTKFKASPLKRDELSGYESWAMGFFHQACINPNISMTIQLDITNAEKIYQNKFIQTSGASLTAFLIWNLIRSIRRFPCLSWRKVDGQWHNFDNLPLFMPIATGKTERFKDVLLMDIVDLPFAQFCDSYRHGVDEALNTTKHYTPIDELTWNICYFIGNLPNLQFSSLSFQVTKEFYGKCFFYFGRRYKSNDRTLLPMHITSDHSNTDGYIWDQLIDTYSKLILEDLKL